MTVFLKASNYLFDAIQRFQVKINLLHRQPTNRPPLQGLQVELHYWFHTV